MRRRLSALLLVALTGGTIAGAVANAKGRPTPAHAARIPALPRLPEVANRCPVPAEQRHAFATAAQQTDLPWAMPPDIGGGSGRGADVAD